MTSSGVLYDTNLRVLANALANGAIFFVDPADPGGTGKVHVQVRGGWKKNVSTLHIEIQAVETTNENVVANTASPKYRMAPGTL